MPARLEDTPAFLDTPPDPGVLRYQEGVFAGHRWYDARSIEPAFPFGFGLSYTTVEVTAPRLASSTVGAGGVVAVEVEVRNVGARAGSAVVQVYVGDPSASVRRPPRELRGFGKVHLAPGEAATVSVALDMRALAFWDPATDAWVAEPGEFLVWAGTSSRDLSAPVPFVLTERWSAPASGPFPPG
jgi:beta-glucosidase